MDKIIYITRLALGLLIALGMTPTIVAGKGTEVKKVQQRLNPGEEAKAKEERAKERAKEAKELAKEEQKRRNNKKID